MLHLLIKIKFPGCFFPITRLHLVEIAPLILPKIPNAGIAWALLQPENPSSSADLAIDSGYLCKVCRLWRKMVHGRWTVNPSQVVIPAMNNNHDVSIRCWIVMISRTKTIWMGQLIQGRLTALMTCDYCSEPLNTVVLLWFKKQGEKDIHIYPCSSSTHSTKFREDRARAQNYYSLNYFSTTIPLHDKKDRTSWPQWSFYS